MTVLIWSCIFCASQTPDDYVIVTQFLQGGEFFDRLQAMQHYSEKVGLILHLLRIFLFFRLTSFFVSRPRPSWPSA
jgi:hypothetical protein